MNPAPLVSVIIPTRNRAALLIEAMRSVLEQDYPAIELIVVDDGSRDATREILAAEKDQRLRVLHTSGAIGPAAARNYGLAAARGEFVTGLDDDDWMLPGRIAALVAGYQPPAAFVCSRWIQEQAGQRRVYGARPGPVTLEMLLHGNVVGNQILAPAAHLGAVGGYDTTLPASEDYDLWTRLVLRFGPAIGIATPSLVVRGNDERVRVSTSTTVVEGARLYFERYSTLMTWSQRRSQRLILAATARRRLTLREALACLAPQSAAAVLRYALRSNLPRLAAWLDRLPRPIS